MVMTSKDADPFAEIRPYRDDEVPGVIERLRKDPGFSDALARLRLEWLHSLLPGAARWLVGRWLDTQLKGIETVDQVQMLVKPALEQRLATSAEFSSSGLEGLDAGTSWLFISNHRDITMDPALTNYALHQAGHRTAAIAIGDNLLSRPWVADLMRLNKSFVVKRNLSGPRELLAASRQLAGYIRWAITSNQGPVWLAQREGRAKDGIDATEPAVIKMLALSRDRKVESVGQVLSELHIVPLAISYELDPCDALKAAELAAGPGYKKAPDEDVRSIALGIMGRKGRVHLAFGQPIDGADLEVPDVVAAIDSHVRSHYCLFETNLWAWQKLNGTTDVPAIDIQPGTVTREAFDERLNAMPEAHRPLALAMYANPLISALEART